MNNNINLNTFSSQPKYTTSSTKEFLESNSLIAKISFLLFVLVMFVLLLRLGITIIANIFSSGKIFSNANKLFTGSVDAKQLLIIEQDPSNSSSKTIYRSVNASDGIEFTWSFWIYINNYDYNKDKYKCVFYKGNDFYDAKNEGNPLNEEVNKYGLNFPNNSPGVYLAPNMNDLIVFMNTFNTINERVIINDIPINKWVSIIIQVDNKTLDVYVNGTITKSHELHGVPKQNYGQVWLGAQGGFDGYVSNLWYYPYTLGISKIENIVNSGPNTNIISSTSLSNKTTNYLSLRWYFTQ